MSNWNSATIRGAWHDATCPAGPECSDRSMHALSLDYMVAPLERFLEALPGGSIARRSAALPTEERVRNVLHDLQCQGPCEPAAMHDATRAARAVLALFAGADS